jgi:3-dehydroquinate synthase
MPTVKVDLTERSYDVVIGAGALKRFDEHLRKLRREGRLFVIFDAQVYALHGERLMHHWQRLEPTELVVPVSEKNKTMKLATEIIDFLLSHRVTRSDTVVAVGGGVLSDIVGFAAATTLRGLKWVVVSTTLLGMVDAAIGGKTGVNHPCGKNLVGAFWQPRVVLCDLSFLPTLPPRELVAGLGEVVKYAGLMGDEMTNMLARFIESGDLLAPRRLTSLISECVRYKADIVAADEREGGLRMLLNYGHTFGHAIEVTTGYHRLRHGEAVILGILAANEMSCLLGYASRSRLEPYSALVRQMLPLIPRTRLNARKLVQAMALDKKRDSQTRRFVLIRTVGEPIIVDSPTDEVITEACERMIASYQALGA